MPLFFSKESLTKEQKDNWDNAVSIYNKITEYNAHKEYLTMTTKEKKKYMSLFGIKKYTEEEILTKLIEDKFIFGNNSGNEKSALFFRILSKGKILKYPPPVLMSYPFYSMIEDDKEKEIHLVDAMNTKELIHKKNEYIKYKYVSFNQSIWKVVNIISDTKVQITYDEWEKEGFIWEMEIKTITAEESGSSIVSHHNQAIKKITKYEDLLKESEFHVKNHFDKIFLAKDNNLYQKHEENMITRYKNNGKAIANQDLITGKTLLATRISQKLSEYPTDDEMRIEIQKQVDNYLGKDYFIENGIIYKKAWMLKRVAPEIISEDLYLKF